MKQKFSVSWKGSKQPRKQRKYRASAPLHIRRKMMSVNLAKELRKKYGKRNFPVRKGDGVKVMTGEFKGKNGKIESVDYTRLRVMIEGIYRNKKDGTKTSVYFSPSNLQIKDLILEDKNRKRALERKAGENDKVKDEGKKELDKKDKKTEEDKLKVKDKEKENVSK
ncbi:50S ribosomal protein L24 [Candidatus Pacearchaeota archaeon]|jgi:large subunit ribosomal protein L24|nr:50S ribosomal protein L24 [Candidatus Pacearchaeota archaeon]